MKFDKTNNRFGKLKVIKFTGNSCVKGRIWLCKCDCGAVIERNSNSLMQSKRLNFINSCGCSNKKGYGYNAMINLYFSYKRAAKNRKLAFNLSKKGFMKLTSQNCYYCKIEPKQTYYKKGSNGNYIYNGVDRMNNNLGYSIKNCVTCCKLCNRAKNNMPYEDFIEYINRFKDIV